MKERIYSPSQQNEAFEEQKAQEAAVRFASLGMPSKAINNLMRTKMAPDTKEVEDVMRSKFPPAPPWQATFRLPPSPPANEVTPEAVKKGICGFKRGAGAGPSGLRPDFLRQLIEHAQGTDVLETIG